MNGINCKDSKNIYYAGLFDGEGSVNITISGGLAVTLTMTHYETINELLRYGGSVNQIKRYANRKAAWRWYAGGKQAYDFLTAIYDWSITKKAEIATAVEFYKLKTPRVKDSTGKFITTNNQSLTQIYKNRLESLRHKGAYT